MAENSKIEWTHHTINLWWGCTEVHAGCDNCYARAFANWLEDDLWNGKRKRILSAFSNLHKWQRKARAANEIHRVFLGSMMDWAEKSMPLINPIVNKVDHFETTDDLRQELFTQIGMGHFDNLLFLMLTKRPSNIPKIVPAGWLENPPANVMYGCSVSDQKTADTLIPQLLKVKGKKFLSIEPQLDFVDLTSIKGSSFGEVYQVLKPVVGARDSNRDAINWVIQGGESGDHKRPFDVAWARSMRDQCAAAGVPYFFKQIDKVQPIPEDLQIRQFP